MIMHTSNFFHKMLFFILPVSIFAFFGSPSLKAEEIIKPDNFGKKQFENFLVSIVTGHDKDGRIIPPYLIVTEQRFIGEIKMPYACFSNNTSEVLIACLLVSHTSSIDIGEHKITIIRNMYQFKPPDKKYILRRENFENLKDSYPFNGLIIDTDGQRVQGDIGPLPTS